MRAATLAESRDARTLALGAVGAAVGMALAAQVAIPIPGTSVPFTLQPFVVVLTGLWLGPRAAAAGMVLYLLAGAAGLPVFAPMGAPGVARLLGPTGGYLLAYPVAAYATARLAGRAHGFAGRALAATAGMAVIHLGGLAQLWVLTGSPGRAAQLGVLPFVTADIVKAHIAALLARSPAGAPAARDEA